MTIDQFQALGGLGTGLVGVYIVCHFLKFLLPFCLDTWCVLKGGQPLENRIRLQQAAKSKQEEDPQDSHPQ